MNLCLTVVKTGQELIVFVEFFNFCHNLFPELFMIVYLDNKYTLVLCKSQSHITGAQRQPFLFLFDNNNCVSHSVQGFQQNLYFLQRP